MVKTEVTHEHARNFHMGDMAIKVVAKCSVQHREVKGRDECSE
jgi:hypothetical protein